MSNALEVPNYPGAAKIDYVYHDNGTEKTDITLFVQRIDIHSDVQSVATRCHVQINDFENLMYHVGFAAGDIIAFNIKENGREFERRYKISKISDILNLENGRLYKLILVSELEYASFHVKISKYFVGKSSEVAKGILDNYTREGSDFWEESTSLVEFIAPMWSPLKTLNWISKKSRSSLSPSRFVFFQNSKQFWNFMSLPFLRSQYSQNPITLRYYQNTTTDNGVPDTEKIMTTIQGLKYYDAFDLQKEIKRGNIMNTDFIHDLTSKNLQIWKNSYWDTYSNNALNQLQQWQYEELGSGLVSHSIKQKYSMALQDYPTPNDEVSEDLLYGKGQQIEITLYGNDVIDIGQVVNVEIPSPEPHKASIEDRKDKVWSGLYYVVSKHDAYDKTGHTMALRLAKDSFIS